MSRIGRNGENSSEAVCPDEIELLGSCGEHSNDQKNDKHFKISCTINETCAARSESESLTTGIEPSSRDSDFVRSTRHAAAQRCRPAKQPFLTGWRPGAVLSLVGATAVTVINFAITIWVWKNPNIVTKGGIGVLSVGSCGRVRRQNQWIHLLVNVVSTLLLCSSNYCMQILIAPTRTELDRAHAQRIWLHIGIPNLRNLKHIGHKRKIVWIFLFATSLPLHLLINSVIFTNLQANEYMVIPTTENWLHGGQYDTSNFHNVTKDAIHATTLVMDQYRPNLTDVIEIEDKSLVPRYKSVSTSACFALYNNHYVSEVGNVYLIQENPTVWADGKNWTLMHNRTDIYWLPRNVSAPIYLCPKSSICASGRYNIPESALPDKYPSNKWRCRSHTHGKCNVNDLFEVPKNLSAWRPYDSALNHCVVEQVVEICKLQFSLYVALVVILSSLMKAIGIALAMFICRNHVPLVTVGHVVATYLDHPDPATNDCCLYSRRHIGTLWSEISKSSTHRIVAHPVPEIFESRLETREVRQGSKLGQMDFHIRDVSASSLAHVSGLQSVKLRCRLSSCDSWSILLSPRHSLKPTGALADFWYGRWLQPC